MQMKGNVFNPNLTYKIDNFLCMFLCRYAFRDRVTSADNSGAFVSPDEMLKLRLMSIFETPEDYLDTTMLQGYFHPQHVPYDVVSSGRCYHAFKFGVMRCADWMRADSDDNGITDTFSMVLDDLFRSVVLPNMKLLKLWGVDGRSKIEHAIADVYTCQIIR